ncbi:MAG: cell division FtsA domain-containing protein [Candidatus Dojkabacteria bacterium]|nr:cell division FtsA domain-containing protein [Candidatus Dojkabacteria bacterium]MDQ7021331.1 cell division FtsA domain-containing protein [Candidatus Dojkabacteria bacterium]
MFGLKSNKKTNLKGDESFLSVDIGTEFVKVALCEVEGGEVLIYGYAKKRQDEYSMQNAVIVDLEKVTDIVDLAIGDAVTMANNKFDRNFYPSRVVMGIAGELVKGVSIDVEVDREDSERKISKKEIQGILDNVAEYTFEHTINEISEEIGLVPEDIKEIDISIDSIYVNGNKTKNPEGLTGKDIVYKVFSTFAPRTHYSAIERVAHNLRLNLEKIVVEPYALAHGIANMNERGNSAIFIDIGGGTTDIALVKNGDLVGTKMFSVGGRAFTKSILREFNLDYLNAEKLKLDYSLDKLTKIDTTKLRNCITEDIEVWLEGVLLTLESFSEVKEYPPRFYLCGGGSLLPDVRTSIIEYPWTKYLNFKTFPRVELLLPNKVKDVIDLTKTAVHATDVTPLALARTIMETTL